MDLRWSEEDETSRAELRAWLEPALRVLGPPPARDDWKGRRRYDGTWQRMLFDGGYAGINWPEEFGGRGASLTEQLIFYEEITRAGAPNVGVNFVGLLHAGPTLMVEATPEQRSRHLPAILRGDEVWCQGFSEPGAGSDLAALRTRAERDGDDYVISGQKIWTSFAQVADFCELLVRAAAELDALWAMVRRTVSEAAKTGVPGLGGSLVKLYYSELRQRIGDLSLRILDRAALSLDDVDGLASGRFAEERLRTLALTIAAGSSQIQRNIIAERILGLPKEPAKRGRR